jgi:hypothetical protein
MNMSKKNILKHILHTSSKYFHPYCGRIFFDKIIHDKIFFNTILCGKIFFDNKESHEAYS